MFGEPSEIDGECNAMLFIGDNYGDNHASMRCQLAPNHEGLHQEQFAREGGPVTITWTADERVRCDHGCGQWKHDHDRDNEAVQCPKDADDHEFSDCAFCHPGMDAQTCAACGKMYYYERGHKRHCASEPFSCADCGTNGVGPHQCPKEMERFLARGDDDIYGDGAEDPVPAPPADEPPAKEPPQS